MFAIGIFITVMLISNLLKNNFFLLYGENLGLKKDIRKFAIAAIEQKKDDNVEILSLYEEEILNNENNGYFIENEDELASKIIFLLENNEIRTKMGQTSKDMVSKFDWLHISKAIVKEYENIISNS